MFLYYGTFSRTTLSMFELLLCMWGLNNGNRVPSKGFATVSIRELYKGTII